MIRTLAAFVMGRVARSLLSKTTYTQILLTFDDFSADSMHRVERHISIEVDVQVHHQARSNVLGQGVIYALYGDDGFFFLIN